MTEDNCRQNAADELRNARETLRAAELLIDAGLARDAASRIYYAAYHAGRALLFARGVEARSHRATRSLLARHFVRAGLVDDTLTATLAELEGLRLAGDYETDFATSADSLRPELARAGTVVDAAAALIIE